MKKHLLCVLATGMLTWPLFAQNVLKTMLRLPDTGQTQSFTDTPGEDSDYSIFSPFFQINSNGTATDTVTGLMWQQMDGGEMTIEAAEQYCQNLDLAGYTDWRLPTAQEAFSMFNHSRQNPPLDPAVFPNSGAEYWWTGERQAGSADKVWVTNAGGGIGNHPKTETVSAGGNKKFHVRAVRDRMIPPALNKRFNILLNTAVDSLTGLEWQRFVVPNIQDSMTWEQALSYAENLVLAGHSDWRLPNVKELESINEEALTQPSLPTDVFPGIGIKKLWSSTSLPNQSVQAWFMDTRYGVVSHEAKTIKNFLLCVRGGSGGVVATPEVVGEALKLYPNPASGAFFVEMDESRRDGFRHLQVFDAAGKLVFETISWRNSFEINGLLPGVYAVKVQWEKNWFCRKMVLR